MEIDNDTQEAIKKLQDRVSELEEQAANHICDDSIAFALRRWFEIQDIAYENMDDETRWLWKNLNGI